MVDNFSSKVCIYPDCEKLSEIGSAYCLEHQKMINYNF